MRLSSSSAKLFRVLVNLDGFSELGSEGVRSMMVGGELGD